MPLPAPSPPPDRPDPSHPPTPQLAFKGGLVLALMLLLLCASVLYVLYARGTFEKTQTLVLVADDSDGVVVGMDLTYAGFAIGRVARIELGDDGNARIRVQVPSKDARWLRTSSIFTLERGLVGGTRIKAFSGVLDDPALPDGAERTVLRGDASAEIPRVAAAVSALLDHLSALTAPQAPLAQTLAQVQTLSERLNGPSGALGVMFGNPADQQKLLKTLDQSQRVLARTDTMLQSADQLLRRVDGLSASAERKLFTGGPGEVPLAADVQALLGDARATSHQINALLRDAQSSLGQLDQLLQAGTGVATNVRGATANMDQLRNDVEANLRKMEQLLNQINRLWPLSQPTEVRLP